MQIVEDFFDTVEFVCFFTRIDGLYFQWTEYPKAAWFNTVGAKKVSAELASRFIDEVKFPGKRRDMFFNLEETRLDYVGTRISREIGYGNTCYTDNNAVARQITELFGEDYGKVYKALTVMGLDESAQYVTKADKKGVYITDIANMCGDYTPLPQPVSYVFKAAEQVLNEAAKRSDDPGWKKILARIKREIGGAQ